MGIKLNYIKLKINVKLFGRMKYYVYLCDVLNN